MVPAPDLHADDVQKLDRLRESYHRLRQELGRVIIGQQETIERLAICLFARGHALLMGVPGLAKTLLQAAPSATLSEMLEREARAQAQAASTADYLEALAAFRAKRKPVFTGA